MTGPSGAPGQPRTVTVRMLELFGHLAYANLMFWSNPGGHDGLPGKHPSTTGMVTKMFITGYRMSISWTSPNLRNLSTHFSH